MYPHPPPSDQDLHSSLWLLHAPCLCTSVMWGIAQMDGSRSLAHPKHSPNPPAQLVHPAQFGLPNVQSCPACWTSHARLLGTWHAEEWHTEPDGGVTAPGVPPMQWWGAKHERQNFPETIVLLPLLLLGMLLHRSAGACATTA